MHAEAQPIVKVFVDKLRLEVPIFQRQYVWDLEHQWTPLWEDIARKFRERLDPSLGRKDAPPHFLGAMVLDQKQTYTTYVERRLVIDGQQRLITLQIFLAAFRDFCKEQGRHDLSDECGRFLLNRGLMKEPDVEQFKVWPTFSDREQFKRVILAGSYGGLQKEYPLRYRKYSRKPIPRPRMIEAYIFFYDQLRLFFIGTDSEPSFAEGVPVETQLDECLQVLQSSLQVVIIDLDANDDPQVIFETLNSRGEPLLPADLLRNFIFMRATHNGESQEELYEKYWKKFDDDFWRQQIRQGRAYRPRSDLLLQHYLTSKITADIPIKHLFTEYKFWINKRNPFSNVEEEVKTLASQGDFYRQLINPSKGSAIYQLASFLLTFDISTVYPFLLYLGDLRISEDDWKEISTILESYIVRRAVCNYTTKNYNQIFLSLIRHIQKSAFSCDRVRAFLSGSTGESSTWPDDGTFLNSWLTQDAYYTLSSSRLFHILKRINDSFLTSKMEKITIDGGLSIEHLLPQKWIENWPLPDGSKGMNYSEMWGVNGDDPVAKASKERYNLLKTFGNLTILAQPLNSAISNGKWSEKREEILRTSLLPLNQLLNKYKYWDENEIQKRGKELFEKARLIWPPPPS